MRPMDCTDIKVLLSGLIDDELDAETRHLAERHIAECRACRDLVDEAEAAHQLLASEAEMNLAPDGLPAGFAGAVLSRTVYDEDHRRGPLTGWVNWLGWMAAAACLVLAITIWALDHRPLTRQMNGPSPVAAAPPATQPTVIPIVYNTPGRSWVSEGEYSPGALEPAAEAATPDEAPADAIDDRGAPDAAAPAEPATTGRNVPAAPPQALRPSVAITRADAETLDATALLLEMLLKGDDRSFADVESIRRIIEYDELLAHLAATRDRLEPEVRAALFAAESILWRIVHGPLSLEDVQELRRTVAESGLPGQLKAISRRWEPSGAL
jgi:hypothetical protein